MNLPDCVYDMFLITALIVRKTVYQFIKMEKMKHRRVKKKTYLKLYRFPISRREGIRTQDCLIPEPVLLYCALLFFSLLEMSLERKRRQVKSL